MFSQITKKGYIKSEGFTFFNGVFAPLKQVLVEHVVEMIDELRVVYQQRISFAKFVEGQLFHIVQRIDYSPDTIIHTGG